MERTQWEYKVLKNIDEKELNKAGDWELISVIFKPSPMEGYYGEWLYFFKRPK